MSIVNYAIEVQTDKSKTANDAYGFDGTTFRWITGRPSDAPAYGNFILGKSPTHFWRFNEASDSIIDLGSVGRDLTTFDYTYGVTGPTAINDTTLAGMGGSYYYDPPTDLGLSQDGSTGSMVIDGWMKIDDISLGFRSLINIQDGTVNPIKRYLQIFQSDSSGGLRFYLNDPDNGGSLGIISTFQAENNVWFYFALVYNGSGEGSNAGTITLYINGILDSTYTAGGMVTLFADARYLQMVSTGMSYSSISITKSDWYTGLAKKDWYNLAIPKWEDGSDNTEPWKEGWILQDEIGDPVRSIDIKGTGDYGTLSGFDFQLSNAVPAVGADALWKWVRDNGIHFTNRYVKLYIVVDDIFYSIWSGVIANNPIEEVGYKFKCIDSFQKIHKVIPPMVVDRNVLPNSDDESQGKSIPINIGDVTYAKILTVTNSPSELTLVKSKPLITSITEGKACAAVEYDTHTAIYPYIKVWTKDQTFAASELQNKFLYVARGGGFADIDVLNKIVNNLATDASGFTIIYMESTFEFVDEATFNERYSYDPYNPTDKIHYFVGSHTDSKYATVTNRGPGASSFEAPGIYFGAIGMVPTPLEYSNWIRFSNVDCSNGGVGCNRINLDMAWRDGSTFRLTVRLNSYDGEIIGSKIVDKSDYSIKEHYESILIKRQYSATTTLVFQITECDLMFNNYYNEIGERVNYNYFTYPFYIWSFTVNGAESTEETWWFSIVEMGGTHLISNNAISKIMTDAGGLPLLYIYDKNRKVMEQVPNNIYRVVTDKSGASGHPEFILYSSNIRKDGEVQYLVPIVPQQWAIEIPSDVRFTFKGATWSVIQDGHINIGGTVSTRSLNHLIQNIFPSANVCNRDQTKTIELVIPDYGVFSNTYSFTVKMEYPREFLAYEIEKVYIGIDANYLSYALPPSIAPVNIRVMMFVDVLDVYGNVINSTQYDDIDNETNGDIVWPTNEIPDTASISLNTLPTMYYDNGGVKEASYENVWGYVGKDSNDEDVTVRSMLELKSELFDMIKDGTASNIIQVRVVVTSAGADMTGGDRFLFVSTVKEIGMVGIRTTNPLNDDYYCRLKGETVNFLETNNVYTAFKLMMETYDGIPASRIDYTNLPVVRGDWTVGRQLNDRKSSYEYIKELAQHSFVGVYPKRDGSRGLKAWREDDTLIQSFNSSNIIRDSIRSWEKTDVSDLYNDFRVWYNWSPAANTYIDSITLTNTDKYYPVVGGVTGAVGFPSATMMMDYPNDLQVWKTYIGGVSPNSYPDAEKMWLFAHESFDIAGASQALPKNLSELPWYTNTYDFNSSTFEGANKTDSPFRYLQNLSEWTTLQKDEVKFNIPISSTYVTLELLDYVSFSDPIYTDNEVRHGWITGIEFTPTKNVMRLVVTLEADPVIVDTVIRERGQLLNFNIYTESGSETGVLVDGQGRI